MPSALVVVKCSTSKGAKFTTVHCAGQVRNGTRIGFVDQAMAQDLLGPRMLGGDNTATNPAVPAAGDHSFIEMLVRLHRGIHGTHVTVDQVYISDGKTEGIQTGPFMTIPLGLGCNSQYHQAQFITAENCAPLNCTMMITKNPALFATRAGRMYLRAAMRRDDIIDGSEDGVTVEVADIARLRAVWEFAEAQSGLSAFYAGRAAANGPVGYCQAQFWPKSIYISEPAKEGVLRIAQPVRNTQLADATGRQTKRGKRKDPTTAQIVAALRKQGLYSAADAVQQAHNAKVQGLGAPPPFPAEVAEGSYTTDNTSVFEDQLDASNYNQEGGYIGDQLNQTNDPRF